MWAAAPYATGLLALALVFAGFFAFRAVNGYLYWSDPAHHDQAIAGWMSPRYVANSSHVPPEVVGNALGLDREKPRRLTLDQLAAERGVAIDVLSRNLEAAIVAWRAANPGS